MKITLNENEIKKILINHIKQFTPGGYGIILLNCYSIREVEFSVFEPQPEAMHDDEKLKRLNHVASTLHQLPM